MGSMKKHTQVFAAVIGLTALAGCFAIDERALEVTVPNEAPVVDVTGPTTAAAGHSVLFTLTATDADEDEAAGFTYQIDWNDDGVVDATVPATPGNGAGVVVSHTFVELGPNTFSVTATDQDGGVSARVTRDVDVIEPLPLGVPGAVSLNGHGVLPVVLFSTADFDAGALDLETLRLSDAVAVGSALDDTDGDGDLDLTVDFRRDDFVDEYAAALAADLSDGTLDDNHQEVELLLTGQTQAGADIFAASAVDFFMTGRKLETLLGTL